MTKKALIIGVTGQDGSLLAKNLINRGLEVHGTFRRGASDKFWRLNELGIRDQIAFHNYNVGNELAFSEIVRTVLPDYIFSLAGESFTALSFEEPKHFMTVNIESAVEQLEAIRQFAPEAKAFFASSSEVFGEAPVEAKLDEDSKFHPKTPYGVSKLTQYYLVQLYREKYHLNLYSGILFPHESAFRSPEFVTRKIVIGLTKRILQDGPILQVGDLSMRRDWGSAIDYVDWMFKLLDLGKPGDYVFGTGVNTSIEEFLIMSAGYFGVTLLQNETNEEGVYEYTDAASGKVIVRSDINKYGANRFSYGAANSSKLMSAIKNPDVTEIHVLAKTMVESEIKRAQK
jgi:GDPmannose 4,6-dehydratase